MPRIVASLLVVLASCHSNDEYGISGTVAGATQVGVLMTLAGSVSASTTTDSAGNYVFGGLANGTYTLTPSLAGYAFTPPSLSVTLAGADAVGENFTCQCAFVGQTVCGSSCVDLDSDPLHCGTCGHDCGLGNCTASQCTCSSSPTTVTMCPNDSATGTCVDTASSTENCGTCGHDCGLGICSASQCTCNSSPSTVKLCRDIAGIETCVDTTSSTKNCGNCGWSCTSTFGPGFICRNSFCTCPPNTWMCPGAMSGLVCTDVQIDNNNCGTCGTFCRSPQVCNSGQCV